ncbi:MAG: FG-GAP-like repeat-containing protein [Phycisphaerales bacterium JB038]
MCCYLLLEDLDGDGDLDLALNDARNDSYDDVSLARILVNDGSGDFSDSRRYLNGLSVWKGRAADLNNDGALDLLNLSRIDNYPWPDESGVTALLGQCVEMCSGDLDGDGDTDQADLGTLLASYGVDDGGDLNGDGFTDQADLGELLSDYGCGI